MGIAILVRHGESETNVRNIISADYTGYPLTQEGDHDFSINWKPNIAV